MIIVILVFIIIFLFLFLQFIILFEIGRFLRLDILLLLFWARVFIIRVWSVVPIVDLIVMNVNVVYIWCLRSSADLTF